ncbi:hypothetical protein C2L64_47170 [Paraburkholderia hospita]|uniref:Uncharacterized protein n=1 Tax=Paraburkholderia hospita TaxID=169430 RepID=A0AAN1MQK1_9BURK|nr:hypothetical protein C2L64_47170 [Paraburkholderia hospita]
MRRKTWQVRDNHGDFPRRKPQCAVPPYCVTVDSEQDFNSLLVAGRIRFNFTSHGFANVNRRVTVAEAPSGPIASTSLSSGGG